MTRRRLATHNFQDPHVTHPIKSSGMEYHRHNDLPRGDLIVLLSYSTLLPFHTWRKMEKARVNSECFYTGSYLDGK